MLPSSLIITTSGYPKPNMTAYKITTQSSPIVEDLTSDISGLVAQWNFQDFASEVSQTERWAAYQVMTDEAHYMNKYDKVSFQQVNHGWMKRSALA